MHDSNRPGKNWGGRKDREGKMAMRQLHRLNDITTMLLDMLNCDDELPSWVQSKLTRAYTDLNDIFGYLEPQSDQAIMSSDETSTFLPAPEVTEAKRGLWANIHARRKAGKRAKKPGEKGYPKTLDV